MEDLCGASGYRENAKGALKSQSLGSTLLQGLFLEIL